MELFVQSPVRGQEHKDICAGCIIIECSMHGVGLHLTQCPIIEFFMVHLGLPLLNCLCLHHRSKGVSSCSSLLAVHACLLQTQDSGSFISRVDQMVSLVHSYSYQLS